MEVDVEVLDVNDDEARALLLSIDPLAALAQTQEQIHQRLLELTPTVDAELEAAWRSAAEAVLAPARLGKSKEVPMGPSQFLVLIDCRDEAQQVALLQRFGEERLDCKALVS